MKSKTTTGIICIKDDLNIEYHLCKIEFQVFEDESFIYTFTPNYNVMDFLNDDIFQGIPGLNLSIRKDKYIRKNIVPTFISERVPSENREDYQELLSKAGLEYMNPIQYLINTPFKYSGDDLYVKEIKEPQKIRIDEIAYKNNIYELIHLILKNMAMNNVVILPSFIKINDLKTFKTLSYLYRKSLIYKKEKQKEGILATKKRNIYKGRKPIEVDLIQFYQQIEKVNNKSLTAKQAAKNLNISIDKYYRLKKQHNVIQSAK